MKLTPLPLVVFAMIASGLPGSGRLVSASVSSAYECPFTTCTSRDPEYPFLTHPRLMLWERACIDARGQFSPAIMSCLTHGVFDVMRRCEHEHRT